MIRSTPSAMISGSPGTMTRPHGPQTLESGPTISSSTTVRTAPTSVLTVGMPAPMVSRETTGRPSL